MKTRSRVLVVGGLLVGLAAVGWWAVLAGGADGTPDAAAPAPCDEVAAAAAPYAAKIPGMVAIPEDPVEAAAVMEKLRQASDNLQRAVAADGARIALRRLNSWEGCRLTPAAMPGDAGYERQRQAADALSAIQSIPKERADCFEWATKDAVIPCRIIGWQGQVAKVTDSPDGAIVELLVRPVLVQEGTGSSASTWSRSAARETWKMDANGKLTFQKVETQAGYRGLATP